jgi:hypothetical protein
MESHNLILDRMQRLMCLGLEGQPAAEVIKGTAEIWQEALGRYHPQRLALAFDAVESSATRWPTPANIIACLPTYFDPTYERFGGPREPVVLIEHVHDPEAKARADKAIADCAAKLGIQTKRAQPNGRT